MEDAKNTNEKYGVMTRMLHQLSVILLLVMFFSGFFRHYPGVFIIHASCGVILFAVFVWRFIWRSLNVILPVPSESMMVRLLAYGMHLFLYFLGLAMPLSGFFMLMFKGHEIPFLGVLSIPSFVVTDNTLSHVLKVFHVFGVWVFIGAIVLHVMAALMHKFVYKDHVWSRMFFSK